MTLKSLCLQALQHRARLVLLHAVALGLEEQQSQLQLGDGFGWCGADSSITAAAVRGAASELQAWLAAGDLAGHHLPGLQMASTLLLEQPMQELLQHWAKHCPVFTGARAKTSDKAPLQRTTAQARCWREAWCAWLAA